MNEQRQIIEEIKILIAAQRRLQSEIDALKRSSIHPHKKREITTVVALVVFALTVLAIVLYGACSCSLLVDDKIDYTIDSTDSVDSIDTADSDDTGEDTDIDTDGDTDADTDSVIFCPWDCKAITDDPTFTCAVWDWPEDEPSAVYNPNFFCASLVIKCCQPWPPTDAKCIYDYCHDFTDRICSKDCPAEETDTTKICFSAGSLCCKLEG